MHINEENRGTTLLDTGLNDIFFGNVSSGKENRSKNKQKYQIKLLHIKGSYKQMEKATN